MVSKLLVSVLVAGAIAQMLTPPTPLPGVFPQIPPVQPLGIPGAPAPGVPGVPGAPGVPGLPGAPFPGITTPTLVPGYPGAPGVPFPVVSVSHDRRRRDVPSAVKEASTESDESSDVIAEAFRRPSNNLDLGEPIELA